MSDYFAKLKKLTNYQLQLLLRLHSTEIGNVENPIVSQNERFSLAVPTLIKLDFLVRDDNDDVQLTPLALHYLTDNGYITTSGELTEVGTQILKATDSTIQEGFQLLKSLLR